MKRKRFSYQTTHSRKVASTPFGRKVQRARLQLAAPMVVAGATRSVGYYGRMSATGGEQKFLDVAISDLSLSNTGDIMNGGTLVVIPQGAGESERVGRKVTIRKFMFRGQLSLLAYTGTAAAEAALSNRARVIFYLDKQCNGAAATAGDILGPGTVSIDSFNELVNKGRFLILKDKMVTMTPPAIAWNGTAISRPAVTKQLFFSKKCNIPIEYDAGGTGGITEIRSNNIGCLAISGPTATATGNVVSLIGTCRFRYTDI